MVIFIAIVLDPRYKLQFVEWSFNKLYDKEDADFFSARVKETFNKLFDSYRLFDESGESHMETQSSHEMETPDVTAPYSSFVLEFEKDMCRREGMNKNEVDLYLMEALEKTTHNFDILNWWTVNSTKYPTLGLIARDVLAMPVSTIASESAFSIGGRVLNNYRSSLTPKTVEALIYAQNWFCSTPLTTDFEELLEDFEKLELEYASTPQPNEADSSAESD